LKKISTLKKIAHEMTCIIALLCTSSDQLMKNIEWYCMQQELILYLIDLNPNSTGFKFNWIEKEWEENWCIRYLGGHW
jgi:hypothetical protein